MKDWESKENDLAILILKFPYSSNYGGGEGHTVTLTEGLRKKGAKIYLASSCPVLLEQFKKRGWPNQAVWAGIEPTSKWSVFVFPFLAPFVFLRLGWLLVNYKRKYKINILYCLSLTEKILLTPLTRLFKIKIFWMEHLAIEKWLIFNPYKIFYLWFSRLVTIITVSQAVKKQLIDLGIRPERIKVIYNGIDLKKFKPKPKIAKKQIVIGTVARLCLEKGHTYFLQAAQLALKKIPNLEFWIVGQGKEEEKLKKLALNLDILSKVKFLGFQENIPEILTHFDIFCLVPFRRESFGIAAAEAMASGLPVIASRFSGLLEVVQDKVTGILIPPKDSQALAEAMIKLANNQELREKMGKAGRERVKERFSLERMISEFYKIFYENWH